MAPNGLPAQNVNVHNCLPRSGSTFVHSLTHTFSLSTLSSLAVLFCFIFFKFKQFSQQEHQHIKVTSQHGNKQRKRHFFVVVFLFINPNKTAERRLNSV